MRTVGAIIGLAAVCLAAVAGMLLADTCNDEMLDPPAPSYPHNCGNCRKECAQYRSVCQSATMQEQIRVESLPFDYSRSSEAPAWPPKMPGPNGGAIAYCCPFDTDASGNPFYLVSGDLSSSTAQHVDTLPFEMSGSACSGNAMPEPGATCSYTVVSYSPPSCIVEQWVGCEECPPPMNTTNTTVP